VRAMLSFGVLLLSGCAGAGEVLAGLELADLRAGWPPLCVPDDNASIRHERLDTQGKRSRSAGSRGARLRS
jgi:hypothetical protein